VLGVVKACVHPGAKPIYSRFDMQTPLDPLASLIPCLLLGPAPCDDCPFRARCGVALLACESYGVFVRGLARWDLASRVPTHARYLTVFADTKEEQRTSRLHWLSRPPM
jgi:hypothetical protein